MKLESDPSVLRFCERPGHLHESKDRRVIDFWVSYRTYEEFWLIDLGNDAAVRCETRYVSLAGDEHAPVRLIRFTDIMPWQTSTRNWERMLPYVNAAQGTSVPGFVMTYWDFSPDHASSQASRPHYGPLILCSCAERFFSLFLQGQASAPSHFDKFLSSPTRFSLSKDEASLGARKLNGKPPLNQSLCISDSASLLPNCRSLIWIGVNARRRSRHLIFGDPREAANRDEPRLGNGH